MEWLVWLVPVTTLLSGLLRPKLGLVLFIASLPLFGSPPGGPYLVALDAAALAVIVTTWRLERPSRSKVEILVGWFVALSAVSMLPLLFLPPAWKPDLLPDLFVSILKSESWTRVYSLRALFNLLLGWGLFLSVRRAFANQSLRPMGFGVAFGVVFASGLGLLEQFGVLSLGAYRPIGHALYDTRLHSLFFHPGWFAEFLVLSAPIAIAICPWGAKRIGALGPTLIVVTITSLALTQQRGAWVAVCAQLLAFFLLSRRMGIGLSKIRRTSVVVGGLLLVVLFLTMLLAPGLVEPVRERVKEDSWSLSGREEIWKETVSLGLERPILGWGLGAFGSARDQYRISQGHEPDPINWLTPHNHYLMLFAERGALGLGLMLLILLSILRSAWSVSEPADRENGRLALGFQIGLVGAVVYGLVQYIFFVKSIEFLFWIVIGAVSIYSEQDTAGDGTGRRWWALPSIVLIAIGRLLFSEPLAADEARSFGFHAVEQTGSLEFRWTGSTAVRRLSWKGQNLIIPLANGHPYPRKHPVEVTVKIDGKEKLRQNILGGWEEHTLGIGPPKEDWILIEIEANPTFRPYLNFTRYPELPSSRDIRSLGVAVGTLRWSEE